MFRGAGFQAGYARFHAGIFCNTGILACVGRAVARPGPDFIGSGVATHGDARRDAVVKVRAPCVAAWLFFRQCYDELPRELRMIGETVGHYRILEKIGAGGMGVVYRALDTHLNRPVAIKMLPAAPVADPERKRRFAQEAKAASALSHPHIVHIYDIDTAHGESFIAMEFVPGKSLDHLIGPKGLPLRDALKYAVEIADALAAAHSAGIVHRDLKPGNIMVTDQKTIKVLDFGLAKLTEPAPAPGPDSPTLTMPPQTETGVIAGTASYMSPEQAEGKPVDARSDIFSLGSVLYEMVTGRRAFSGDTVVATLSSILSAKPTPVRELVPGAARELDRIIALCLRKDRAERLQHMDDVKILLQELRDEVMSAAPPPGPQARGWTRFRTAVVAALCAAAVAAFFGIRYWQARSGDSRMDYEFTRVTADAGLTTEPAISADGKLIAYASDRGARGGLDIWVQHAGVGEPIQITRDEADDHEPSFSPDGSAIVFRSEREGGGIYVVPSLGGEPRLIAREGHDPRFSPDGARIAYWTGAGVTVSAPSQIYVAPVAGGPSRPAQSDLPFARHPVWTPDGKHLLFWGMSQEREIDWFVVPADAAGKPVKTGFQIATRGRGLIETVYPADWLSGQALYSAHYGDSLELFQIPLSPRNWQITGPPQRLTFGTGMENFPGSTARGQLVFASLTSNVNVWSLAVDGALGKVTGPLQQVTYGSAAKYRPALSRDGRKLAFDLGYSVVAKDLGSGKETTLTTAGFYSSWSADGSKVAYSIGRGQKMQIDVVNPGGIPETVCDDCGLAPAGWSSDGSKILYDWGVPQTVQLLDLATRKKVELLRRPGFSVTQASFSPDDRWISFLAGGGPNRNRVCIIPFRAGAAAPPESEWIGVTDGDSFEGQPRWSAEGNLMYFLSNRDGSRCIWAQRLHPLTKRPIEAPLAVYHFHSARRSLSNVGNVGLLGLGVARDRLVFNLGELTGNIWTATLQPRAVTPARSP
jgi:Tol biopolymer transport system component/predicted Ser/Thr protein kinase